MKILIVCLYAAVLLLSEGKSLSYDESREIEGEDVGVKQPKYVVEKRIGFSDLKQRAKEQYEKLKEFAKTYGLDIDSLTEKYEQGIEKFKEFSKSKGLDIDQVKEKLDSQVDRLKGVAKRQGFDLDEMKEKAKAQLGRLDTEKIKNWATRKFNLLKEHGPKLVDRQDKEAFDNFKKKAKDALRGFFSKILD